MNEQMEVTSEQNFCRVFELPDQYPEGFCFGGGKPVTMVMVDWFNPINPQDFWNEESTAEVDWSETEAKLKKFISGKQYVRSGKKYLVITDFGKALVIEK